MPALGGASRDLPLPSAVLLSEVEVQHRFGLAATVLAVACGVTALVLMVNKSWLFLGLFVVALVFVGFRLYFIDRANRLFRQRAVADALSSVFTDVRYEAHGSLESARILALPVFDSADEAVGSHLIVAEHDGRPFERCDATVGARHSGGPSPSGYAWRWTGQIVALPFPGPSPAVHVMSRDFTATCRGAEASRAEWQRVTSNVLSFDEIFEVYAQDPSAAEVVLTRPMIDAIVRLSHVVARPLAVCFVNREMVILISLRKGEHPFDVTAGRSTQAELEHLGGDVQLLADIVESFCLVG